MLEGKNILKNNTLPCLHLIYVNEYEVLRQQVNKSIPNKTLPLFLHLMFHYPKTKTIKNLISLKMNLIKTQAVFRCILHAGMFCKAMAFYYLFQKKRTIRLCFSCTYTSCTSKIMGVCIPHLFLWKCFLIKK